MRECGDCDLAFTRNSVPATPAFKSVSVSRSRHSRYWRSLQDLPIQGTPVILRVHVHAGHALVGFHNTRVFIAPTWDVEVVSEPGSHERQTSVHCLHVVATDEFPILSMKSLVLNAAGHRIPAIHPYGFFEHRPHRATHVTHVVSPNLSGRVR